MPLDSGRRFRPVQQSGSGKAMDLDYVMLVADSREWVDALQFVSPADS